MTVEDFVSRLPGPKRNRGSYWMACCPAHDDKNASLAVKQGESAIMVKCHAGCAFQEIDAKCKELGLQISQEHGTEDTLKGVSVYTYVDHLWRPVIKKIRTSGKSGKKEFTVKSYDKATDKWVVGLGGCRSGETIGLLYRLPDVITASKLGVTVHICEGEKACDRLRQAGIVATCQPNGAGRNKWTKDHTAHLRGASVVVWADRDQIGEQYAVEVATLLQGTAKSVKIVQSMTEGEHDDAYDHLEAGYAVEDAVHRADLTPDTGHKVRTMAEFQPEHISYLWQPYLPKGKVILLDADGGVGKTTVCMAIAAGLSKGYLPCETKPSLEPTASLYYGQEDTPGELRVVYDACGGDPRYMYIHCEHFVLTEKGLRDVRDTIIATGAKFVVFDALIYFLEGVVKDVNVGPEVAPVLRGLAEIATETGCTIVALRHTVKGSVGRAASNLGMGSVQFRNTARGQLVLRRHPDYERHRGWMVITHEKGSILNPSGQPVCYVRRGNGIEWCGQLDHDPFSEDFVRGASNKKADIEDAVSDALADVISEMISTAPYGSVSARDAEAYLDSRGFSKSQINRAKNKLGITSVRTPGGWVWRSKDMLEEVDVELFG